MTEDKFEFRGGKVFCKCGWEMVLDSMSRQHTNRMKCPNPECCVQVVTLIRPKRNSRRPVRFQDVKTCVVTK